jgi:hypothetical protein
MSSFDRKMKTRRNSIQHNGESNISTRIKIEVGFVGF